MYEAKMMDKNIEIQSRREQLAANDADAESGKSRSEGKDETEQISVLGLSNQVEKALRSNGIVTVKQLINQSESTVRDIVGNEGLEEIREKVASIGLRLNINSTEYVATDSLCPVSEDGVHRWEEIWGVSNNVIQEYECEYCRRRSFNVF